MHNVLLPKHKKGLKKKVVATTIQAILPDSKLPVSIISPNVAKRASIIAPKIAKRTPMIKAKVAKKARYIPSLLFE